MQKMEAKSFNPCPAEPFENIQFMNWYNKQHWVIWLVNSQKWVWQTLSPFWKSVTSEPFYNMLLGFKTETMLVKQLCYIQTKNV